MNRLSYPLFGAAFLLSLLIPSCRFLPENLEPEKTVSGFVNGSMEEVSPVNPEQAKGWAVLAQNFNPPNNYVYERTSRHAFEGSYSAMLSAQTIDSPDEFWYLVQVIDGPALRAGSRLQLSAMVRTDNLRGRGFEVILRGVHAFNPQGGFYMSTASQTRNVQGSNDWRRYQLEVARVPEGISQLEIFLMISPGTTGDLYFDDVRLLTD